MNIILFIALAAILGLIAYRRFRMMGIDSMNVYKLYLGKSKVFTKMRKFISEQGLPTEAIIHTDIISISSMDDIYDAINKSHELGLELNLLYEGYTMNYFSDGRLVIFSIDLRISNQGLKYKNIIFDNDFTFSDFETMFPHSANIPLRNIGQSLFEINTKEWLPQSESFMVTRWSKDNIFATPTVEFTFLDNKLIYIFFANF